MRNSLKLIASVVAIGLLSLLIAREAKCQTVISGTIKPETPALVYAAIARGEREFYLERSNGGDAISAMVIADMLNKANASATVSGPCKSACAAIALATARRFYTGYAEVEVHGARYAYPQPGRDDDAPARAMVEQLVERGVDRAFAERRMYGPNLYRVPFDELRTLGFKPRD